jgi:hypothetical protein
MTVGESVVLTIWPARVVPPGSLVGSPFPGRSFHTARLPLYFAVPRTP